MQVVDACTAFREAMKPLQDTLEEIAESLDFNFTCNDVYAALGAGGGAAIFASFFPGISPVVNGATKVIHILY